MGRRIRYPYAEPTPAQLRKARSLGIDIPPGIKRGALSDLIDITLEKREPTAEQLAFAKALDIEVTEGMTFDDVSALLDQVVAERSREAMQSNPALRSGKIIMYKGLPFEIWSIGNIGGRHAADLRPCKVMLDRFTTARPKPRDYRRWHSVNIITIAAAEEVTKEKLHEFMLAYFENTD
jgi:hypothetical protein